MSSTAPGALTTALTTALTGSGVAIGLAAVAAFCFAGAAVLQHRAVNSGPVMAGPGEPGPDAADNTLSMGGLRAVARTPGWLLGLALAAGGTTLHAVALVLAPLSVVQPIGVLAVPIAVLISVVRTRRRPTPGVTIGVGLAVAGVAGFVLTAAGTAVSTPAADSAMAVAGLVVAGIVAAFALLGLSSAGWVRCVACATAGAVAFGLVSALMRAVSQLVTTGTSALFDPAVITALAGLVAGVVVGGWLVQQAFASGPPEVVVACLTVVDPIVAVLLGVVLLGEGAATPLETWLPLIGAAAVATVGVVGLASHHPDALARRAAAHVAAHDSAHDPAHDAGGPTRRFPRSDAPRSAGLREHVLHRR